VTSRSEPTSEGYVGILFSPSPTTGAGVHIYT
jgi:hypothetical protein